MSNAIILSLRVPVETCRTANGFVATCEFLDISEAGLTTDEALTALTDALSGYFRSCYDNGRFDELFRSRGYSTQMTDVPSSGGRFVDVHLVLNAPRHMLAQAAIAGGTQPGLESCAT